LERLADEDTLVPLANRRAFVRELSRMMSFAERYDSYGAVIYFDVNHLKSINDKHGHAAGDAVLKHISEVLLAQVRTSDLVGRLGGDEFGVALAQTDKEAALVKATSLAVAITESSLAWNGAPLKLSVSWGIHPFSGADHADTALAAADRAMYDQKRGATTPPKS
jgi:diguanylate cyclase (GGDEF)-like protein